MVVLLTLRLRLAAGLGAFPGGGLLLQLDLAWLGILLRELVSRRVNEIIRARGCYTQEMPDISDIVSI